MTVTSSQIGDYHTLYVDANNLYGLCQTYKLPCGNFKFRRKYKQLDKTKKLIKKYKMEDDVGYLLEVDLVNIRWYKIQYLVSFGYYYIRYYI